MRTKGILLINLGTPDSTSCFSIIRYLVQFLNDPRVIDLPSLLRFFLVNILIIPKRFWQTRKAYQKIWGHGEGGGGSPLLTNSVAFKEKLALALGNEYQVELAMRYGSPNIPKALQNLSSCEKVIVIPLFPQYTSAATGSAVEHFMEKIKKNWNTPDIYIQKDFYDHPAYITSYIEQIENYLTNKKVDKIVFSYHGLPERHINKSKCQSQCDKINACPKIDQKNAFCYRAQCFSSSQLIAKGLNLTPKEYIVSFQSRLGKTPWIKPYTDFLLPDLIKQGVKNIAIVCPSFVADCLETLEEINIRAREEWKSLGGGEFYFIPCLNANPTWVERFAKMLRENH